MDVRVAYKLIELRKKQALTQQGLAEALETDEKTIAQWESAEAIPDNHMLRRLSELYNVSFDEILTPLQEPEAPAKIEEPVVEDKKTQEKNPFTMLIASYPIAVVIFYLLAGSIFKLWDIAWLMFLTIPLVPVLCKASGNGQYSAEKTFSRFLTMYYPGVLATLYVNLGVIFGWWHPTWIIFLTIPLFYIFKGARKSCE